MELMHFYPRSPCGERPAECGRIAGILQFLSTLSLRRATQLQPNTLVRQSISIHALLAESDRPPNAAAMPVCISIHALLAESDSLYTTWLPAARQFLSTLSLRRATAGAWAGAVAYRYFYPRSPCGERLLISVKIAAISAFLSTLSLRRAT